MFEEVSTPACIILKYIASIQQRLLPFLRNQRYLESELGGIIKRKADGQLTHAIDAFSDKTLFNILRSHNLSCEVYSEESGWRSFGGSPKYQIICDPYCNTLLTLRSFRESAVAVCITDMSAELVACAIGDLQTDRIFYADPSGAFMWELHCDGRWKKSSIHVSSEYKLEDAFVVASLLKRERRIPTISSDFFCRAGIIHAVDGAIMIGRLAAGNIDAYVDPFKGQPIYEVPCCELIVKAGGIVTDVYGSPFSLMDIVKRLKKDPNSRYQLVAACTERLHNSILNGLDRGK